MRSPVHERLAPAESRQRPRAPPNSVLQGFRASIASVSGSISVTTKGAEALARSAEHPLDVRGDRETPRSARVILDRQPRNLDRVVERHKLQELERDPVRGVLETAVALAVAGDIGREPPRESAAPSASRARRVFVAHVDHFARRVADRVVRPGRELVFAAVDRPGIAARLRLETWKPKEGLAMTLIQGAGVHCPSPRMVDVFAAVRREAAEAIEELELRPRRQPAPAMLRRATGAVAAAAERARIVCRRLTCSDKVPRRLKSTARAAVWSRLRTSAETQISARRMNTLPAVRAPSCR